MELTVVLWDLHRQPLCLSVEWVAVVGQTNALFCCPPVMGRLVPKCESRFHVWLGPSHVELHISPSFLGSVYAQWPPHDYLVCEILSSMCKLKNCDLVIRDLMVQDTHTQNVILPRYSCLSYSVLKQLSTSSLELGVPIPLTHSARVRGALLGRPIADFGSTGPTVL